MNKKRVALYARVSTLNGQDPEMQLRELREYCERRGLQIVEEFTDKGVSGSHERRPALDRLLADCRKRLVDAVVVHRYDRFGRSLRQLVNALRAPDVRVPRLSTEQGLPRRGRLCHPAQRAQRVCNLSRASLAP